MIRDVSFDLAPGEALGIVGESGCGKTITTRALLGLLPDGGRVTRRLRHVRRRRPGGNAERDFGRIRGNMIALVSQEPMSGLDPSFPVGSQLTEVIRRHHAMSRGQARARAVELLALVNLPEPREAMSRYPHELSGGMAQRVSIALALAGKPPAADRGRAHHRARCHRAGRDSRPAQGPWQAPGNGDHPGHPRLGSPRRPL